MKKYSVYAWDYYYGSKFVENVYASNIKEAVEKVKKFKYVGGTIADINEDEDRACIEWFVPDDDAFDIVPRRVYIEKS